MSATARPEVSLEAAQALARHLRECPDDAKRPADELARQFGLSTEFVRELLQSLNPSKENLIRLRPDLSPIRRAIFSLRLLFRRITSNPLAFIAITAAASIAGYLLFDSFVTTQNASALHTERGDVRIDLNGNDGVFLTFALTTVMLHLLCYFRHGMVRYPLMGGLICWLISAPTLVVILWAHLPEQADVLAPVQLIAVSIGMLFLNGVYAAIGVIAAVVGGAWRLREQDRARETLSRQELLERMFDIQERLEEATGARSEQRSKFWMKFAPRMRRRPWAYATGFGIGLSLLNVLVFGVAFARIAGSGPPPPLLVLFRLTLSVIDVVLMIAVGFFSPGTLRAIFNTWLYAAVAMLPLLIPVGSFGPAAFEEATHPTSLAVRFGLAFVVAALAAAGAKVEERAALEHKLLHNDPAALLAELVRLQWQLSPQTTDICVVVVDAARSAEMKASADPLAVEYSFREYQGFLENVVEQEGGHVISTAGDGAIAEFPCVDSAYRASRRVQTEIETFNREINRLDRPFRLRVGLHMGPVAGSINDVEFSAVIDIAAHVQAAAPIGGVALTEEVSRHLPGESFVQLAEPVDGQIVLLSMRPTLDD